MAKNTSSNAFRKIDVDQYNEDNFREDDGVDSAAVGPDENEITSLLTKGQGVEALLSALQNAPLRCKNQHVKVEECVTHSTDKRLFINSIAGQRTEHNTARAVIDQVNANRSGYRLAGAERPDRCAHEIHISGLRNTLRGLQWASAAVAREGIRQGRRWLHRTCALRHEPCLKCDYYRNKQPDKSITCVVVFATTIKTR